MPIEKTSAGGTLITGSGIQIYSLLSLKWAIILEGKGLKRSRGGSATAIAMQQFGIPGKASARNRALVLQSIEDKIKEVGSVVRD